MENSSQSKKRCLPVNTRVTTVIPSRTGALTLKRYFMRYEGVRPSNRSEAFELPPVDAIIPACR